MNVTESVKTMTESIETTITESMKKISIQQVQHNNVSSDVGGVKKEGKIGQHIERANASSKKNDQHAEAAAQKMEKPPSTNTIISKKTPEKNYPWNVSKKGQPDDDRDPKDSVRKSVINGGGGGVKSSDPKKNPGERNKNLLAPKSGSIKLYPSIDETSLANDGVDANNASLAEDVVGSSHASSTSMNEEKIEPRNTSVVANHNHAPYVTNAETPLATNTSGSSSDRFVPVYVQQNANLDNDNYKENSFSPSVDDDRSLGQTVASSTYGDDRVKVMNKKLLDPYGDKGTYTGVVLRNTGMPHGLGRMVYEEDRRVFEGDWRHGRWHGYGRASFSNGDSYEGEYKFDQRHGTGIYRWNDGRVYDGQFSEDKRHGKGVFTWPDGAIYDGDFVNGQRQGHGKYTFADGGRYEGSWKDGRYDGFGTCTWEDGRRYRGEWRNGMAHGRGTETYPDGTIRHEGEWIDDEPIR